LGAGFHLFLAETRHGTGVEAHLDRVLLRLRRLVREFIIIALLVAGLHLLAAQTSLVTGIMAYSGGVRSRSLGLLSGGARRTAKRTDRARRARGKALNHYALSDIRVTIETKTGQLVESIAPTHGDQGTPLGGGTRGVVHAGLGLLLGLLSGLLLDAAATGGTAESTDLARRARGNTLNGRVVSDINVTVNAVF
jgi:hypothetical protein